MNSSLSASWTYKQIPHYKENVIFEVYIKYPLKSGDAGYNSAMANTWVKYKEHPQVIFKELLSSDLFQERAAVGHISWVMHDAQLGLDLHTLNSTQTILLKRVHEGMDNSIAINNLYYMVDSQYSSMIDDNGVETITYNFNAIDLCGILDNRLLRMNKFYPGPWPLDPETQAPVKPQYWSQYVVAVADLKDENLVSKDVMIRGLQGQTMNPESYVVVPEIGLWGLRNVVASRSSIGTDKTCGTDCAEKTVLQFLADSNWRTVYFHYLVSTGVDDPTYGLGFKTDISIKHSEDTEVITLDYSKSFEHPNLFNYNMEKEEIESACYVLGDTDRHHYEYIVNFNLPLCFEGFSSNTDDSNPENQAEERLRTNQTFVSYDIELAFQDKLPFVDFFVGTKIVLKGIYPGIEDVVLYIRSIQETISEDTRQVIIKLEEPPVF